MDNSTPRTLEEVCEKEDFRIMVYNNVYCSLATCKKIECAWQSPYRDHNGLYICLKCCTELEAEEDYSIN